MLLNYNQLSSQFKFRQNVTGIIHIGGHTGEEFDDYCRGGVENLIAFEPQKWCYDKMVQEAHRWDFPKENMFNLALGDEPGEVEMYCNPDGASSSLLKPKLHLEVSPDVVFNTREKVQVVRLDDFIEEYCPEHPFNFINMDVQGYEMKVLKGAIKTLESIKYVYCEINTVEMYEGCPLVEELDEFLKQYNLTRIRTGLHGSGTWGDGFYIHEDLI